MKRPSGPDYRTLSADEIVKTAVRLADRIHERFPGTGLAGAGRQLRMTAEDTARRARALSRPYIGLRTLLALFCLGGLGVLAAVLKDVDWRGIFEQTNEVALTALLESSVNLVLLMAAGLWFLLTLEERWKRSRTQAALHELRSFAHVVDMHQLTKDPERSQGKAYQATKSSPAVTLDSFQLRRYLDYCSELLALTGKIAAVYLNHFDDPVMVSSVNEVETLTTDLSRKIWQKIMILHSFEQDGLKGTEATGALAATVSEPPPAVKAVATQAGQQSA